MGPPGANLGEFPAQGLEAFTHANARISLDVFQHVLLPYFWVCNRYPGEAN
jgi:hypothetical protein